MSKKQPVAEECKTKLDNVVKFNRILQRNEVLTLHYLGLPYVVLSRSPQLRLKMPVSTFNYQNGGRCGIALQVIFTCPTNYPLELPHVDLVEKRNVSTELELILRTDIALTVEKLLGLCMIVEVVTRLQMLLNNEVRRLPQPH